MISQTTQQFQERFAVSLPTAVFESSEIPKPGFSESFVEALRDSARYEYLGATGYFTTFRLDRNRNRREFQRLDQIRLSILDPSADSLIRAHAEQRLRQRSGQLDQATVDNEIALLRTEIFISLVTLFDIRQNLSTSVFLHRSLPFFRCEMFDHAMYLTYYLGRMQYPETLQFTSATRPYRAYYAGMEFVRRFSTGFVTFGDGGPSADLIDDEAKLAGLLGRLGCAAELNDLRIAKEQKTVALVKRLTEVGISSDSPF